MIHITPKTTIPDLKEEFNKLFPFLKLEFFKHKHQIREGNPKKDLLSFNGALSLTDKAIKSKKIIIEENMTVADLEQMFLMRFGLSAQVFRKSGRSWLETTVTDDWTLKRQNEQGFELSRLQPIPVEKEENL